MNIKAPLVALIAIASTASAGEYHVAITGDDANSGTKSKPFKTISAAAGIAQPGDTITVHAGVYRERVDPPHGGTSDRQRIIYQAARGEQVVITGADVLTGWTRVDGDVWKIEIPNARFGGFNPFVEFTGGDWCATRAHRAGLYLDDLWMTETSREKIMGKPGAIPAWCVETGKDVTVVHAQFPGIDPNTRKVECNMRPVVFYPTKTGVNYITVRGFTLEKAATQWAPPTAEQQGIIGPHWAKGWIIEDNTIRFARCTGVSLGMYGDKFDNSAGSDSQAYLAWVHRAISNGWNKATVGSHIVRRNHIHDCGQSGIVGGMGCVFSTIADNEIHDICLREAVRGAETAAIKFHGGVDVRIAGNHVYRTGEHGVWLDWMAQGAQVTGNLIHDCRFMLISLEVNHGPILVANNILLGPTPIQLCGSHSTAYVHNLGTWKIWPNYAYDGRQTPYFKPHSTDFAGTHNVPMASDDRLYNNIFAEQTDLRLYDSIFFPDRNTKDKPLWPSWLAGNVVLKGATPAQVETTVLSKPDFIAGIKLEQKPDGWYLAFNSDKSWRDSQKRALVTTALLGTAKISDQAFDNPDGTPIKIDHDYFGNPRDTNNPFPGPFEISETKTQSLKVWPVAKPNIGRDH